jgi:hypothetical protein
MLPRRCAGESRSGTHADPETGVAAPEAYALPGTDAAGDLSLLVDVEADDDRSGRRPHACRQTAGTDADAH